MFYSHGSKEKICPTYFEIGQTYFKIQGTYFSPSENLFEKRPENVDKKAAFAVEYRRRWKFVLCMKSVYESTKSAQCQNLWQIIRA